MLQKIFKLQQNGTTVRTEILAGITTFLTMAYVLALNPQFLSTTGMNAEAVFTATAISAIVGTLIMGLWANLPFALAPGIGLSVFFSFTVCLSMGHTWQFALAAVLIEGVIFILLTLFNIREAIVNAIPKTIKNAIGAGIGLYLAFVGMQSAGIIVNSENTLVQLGDITQGGAFLALVGLVVTSLMLIKKWRGALLLGIIITTIIGLFMGITEFRGVVSTPPSLSPLLFEFDFSEVFSFKMAIVVFTFLFVDLFDTLGTLVGVTTRAGMLTPDGKVPNIKKAFMADAVATTLGAMMGTSTVTTYVDSAAGVSEGGRTGLTAVVTAGCFMLALFFAPIFMAIPAAATAPILMLVGLFMLASVVDINFNNYRDSVPAYVTIVTMPLAFSISEGISLGLISYVLLNFVGGNRKELTIGMYVLACLFVCKYLL